MQQSSRKIISNQQGPHPDLEALVTKHLTNSFNKPIADFNRAAFETANRLYLQHQKGFILDSGCGVGESTYHLAKQFPDSLVMGVDQSAHRLNSNSDWTMPDNGLLIRADLVDFWRLAAGANWQLWRHFLLYPNPWPKKKHLQRRWHGHPVFPVLKNLGGALELRTNWKLYAEEFGMSLKLMTNQPQQLEIWQPGTPITPFERKYQASGQSLYRLRTDFACSLAQSSSL
ncbi:MAG: SAM-dependent methyltransferase [Gammaproteobacteria bacterium]|nr:MAG: SAM-dependent methyltransferase [Gammaproteobacteria bacterium]